MAVEAHRQGDVDHPGLGDRQQIGRALQPQPLHMLARGLAHGAGELAMEPEGRGAEGLGHDRQGVILVEVVLHLGQQWRDLR